MLKNSYSHQNPGRERKDFSPECQSKHSPADTLILDLQPPELGREQIFIVLSHPVLGNKHIVLLNVASYSTIWFFYFTFFCGTGA
jgi:hypothetical protein